ncbi:hypothetical protein NZK35_18915 [Stieleria sp. ICT_E10.1]|uniref:hypothetical protein n=1 Tax=Stieleria sedimenti TaxID=2976331 RepID=UPI0021800AD0|nr:hypothetical protein [Stieleria sedimenti]MCS7468730.1 hypothetical protein [Stieleria sedimenti]
MKLAVALLAAMMVGAAGCGEKSSRSNFNFSQVSEGAISWSSEQDGEQTPGIDEAQVLYLEGLVVFWSDFPTPTATSIAYGSERDHLGGGGQFINADFGEIKFHYEMTGRSSGTVVVAGKSYDLAAGGLFLIAARQPTVKVRQLNCDLRNLEMTEKSLRLLMDSERAIAEFFRTAETPRITD